MVDAPCRSKIITKNNSSKDVSDVRGQQTFMDGGLIFLPEATAILTLFPVKLQTRSPKCAHIFQYKA